MQSLSSAPNIQKYKSLRLQKYKSLRLQNTKIIFRITRGRKRDLALTSFAPLIIRVLYLRERLNFNLLKFNLFNNVLRKNFKLIDIIINLNSLSLRGPFYKEYKC